MDFLLDGGHFPIINRFKSTNDHATAVILCQHHLLPAYTQLLHLYRGNNRAKHAPAEQTAEMKKAAILLSKCIQTISPFVNPKLKIQCTRSPPASPAQPKGLTFELVLITCASLSLELIELVLDLLRQVRDAHHDKRHQHLFQSIPKMYVHSVRQQLDAHLQRLIEFVKRHNLPESEVVRLIDKLDRDRLIDGFSRLILNHYDSIEFESKSVFYFNTVDYSVGAAHQYLTTMLDKIYDLVVRTWLMPTVDACVHPSDPPFEDCRQQLQRMVTILLRLFRLNTLDKMYRPLGFICQRSLTAVLEQEHLTAVDGRLLHTYRVESNQRNRLVVSRLVRKFVFNFVLHRHSKADNCEFKADMLGVLDVCRDVVDHAFTLVCAEEDIAHLFGWSESLLLLATRRSVTTTQLGRLDELSKEFFDPPAFVDPPYPWTKIYSLPDQLRLPGFDGRAERIWFRLKIIVQKTTTRKAWRKSRIWTKTCSAR